MRVCGFEVHPSCEVFPLLEGEPLDELVADIRQHGLLEPVVLRDGQVLDGRNRVLACNRAGVPLRTREWGSRPGENGSPTEWVLSVNLHRRHLTESQRAMIGARVKSLFEGEARARQLAGLKQNAGTVSANLRERSEGASLFDSACGSSPTVSANLRERSETPAADSGRKSADDAARRVTVSPRSIESAAKVLQRAVPELVAAVEAGRLAVSTAAVLAGEPPERQRELVAQNDAEILAETKRLKAHNADARRAEAERKERERVASTPVPLVARTIDLRRCDVADVIAEVRGAGLVHADPPWDCDDRRLSEGATGPFDDARTDAIADTIAAAYDCAAADAYLLLWVPFPLLSEWFDASRSLRWSYKTGGVWTRRGGPGVGLHWRGDAELLLLYAKGNPRPRTTLGNGFVSERTRRGEKPEAWLARLVDAFSAPDALVLDLYAGMAPMARACKTTGRLYVGSERDEVRHRRALEALTADRSKSGVAPRTPEGETP